MTTAGGEGTAARPVPCARYAGLAAARFVHPEGVCACFRGGPPPVLMAAEPGDRARTGPGRVVPAPRRGEPSEAASELR